MTTYTIDPIGFINTCFPEKFGIPRQSLLAPSAKGSLILQPPYNHPDCVRGLESVSHVWLSFIFHQHSDKGWKPTVRPPRLGGNEKVGVFATRSSFRPNQLGLSVVALDDVIIDQRQVCLHFSGVDLVDGTPIVDIKPYLNYADSLPYATNAIAAQAPLHVNVEFSDSALVFCEQYKTTIKNLPTTDLKQLIVEVLQQDPRPAYHHQQSQESREYGIAVLDCNVRWVCIKQDGENRGNMKDESYGEGQARKVVVKNVSQ